MPVSQVQRDYLLNEAFELLGRELYGTVWTGRELGADKWPSPDEWNGKRGRLQGAAASFDRDITELKEQRRRTVKEAEVQGIEDRLHELRDKRAEALNELAHHPEPDQSFIANYEAFLRKEHVCEALITALSGDRFGASCLNSVGIQAHWWRPESRYKFDVELSMMWFPVRQSRKRRGAVRVHEGDFDNWLETVIPIDPSKSMELSPEKHAELWFMGFVRSNPERVRRDDLIKHLMDEFPGISREGALRIRRNHAPSEWKRRGRYKNGGK